jgi:hypothetical protein
MKWLVTAALVVMVGAAGCGSDSTGGAGASGGAVVAGCNADPWSCPAGQTCSIANKGKTFACLDSGAGKIGEPCQNIIDQPQCADGLTCFQIQGQMMGVCSPFCDPTSSEHACSSSAPCVNVQFGSAGTAKLCQPDGAGAGGGGGAGSSASTGTGSSGAGGSGGAGGK